MPGGERSSGRYCARDVPIELIERGLVVLRGPTGVGKTDVLRALAGAGAQVLDLEALAGHRGSAFGGLGLPPQPSHAAFQARLAAACAALDPARAAVCEDEAAYLGSVGVPLALQALLRDAPWIELSAPIAARIARTRALHADVPDDALVAAADRLGRRLGADAVRAVQAHIRAGDRDAAISALLLYYDRAYAHRRTQVAHPPRAAVDAASIPDAAAAIARAIR